MKEIGLGVGSDIENQRMRRLGGWGKELGEWIKRVEDYGSREIILVSCLCLYNRHIFNGFRAVRRLLFNILSYFHNFVRAEV